MPGCSLLLAPTASVGVPFVVTHNTGSCYFNVAVNHGAGLSLKAARQLSVPSSLFHLLPKPARNDAGRSHAFLNHTSRCHLNAGARTWQGEAVRCTQIISRLYLPHSELPVCSVNSTSRLNVLKSSDVHAPKYPGHHFGEVTRLDEEATRERISK